MSTTAVPGYPNEFQTQYTRLPKAPLPGEFAAEDLWNARPLSATLPWVDPVAYAQTWTIGNNTPGDVVGVEIAGGEVTVVSGADANATGALLKAKLDASGFVATYIASSTDNGGGVLTVVGQLGQDPTIVPVEEGATTLAIVVDTPAQLPLIVCFGEGVARYDGGDGLNAYKFKRPDSMSDKLLGILLRTTGAKLPAGQVAELGTEPPLNVFNAQPGQTYSIERENVVVVVEYIGNAPTVLDDVYWIKEGADAGKWTTSDGAVSKVVTLTATSVADGDIGFSYNGLPALSLTATGVAADDASALYQQLLASATYSGLFASPSDVVDNLDGTLSLTFAPGLSPVFADASTGTSTVAETVVTEAVAANAELVPQYSWDRATITADAPARAFLRASRN